MLKLSVINDVNRQILKELCLTDEQDFILQSNGVGQSVISCKSFDERVTNVLADNNLDWNELNTNERMAVMQSANVFFLLANIFGIKEAQKAVSRERFRLSLLRTRQYLIFFETKGEMI